MGRLEKLNLALAPVLKFALIALLVIGGYAGLVTYDQYFSARQSAHQSRPDSRVNPGCAQDPATSDSKGIPRSFGRMV